MAIRWGIDLGGTKIEGVVIETEGGLQILDRTRIPTEAAKGYEHIIGQVSRLVEDLAERTGKRPDYLGIGTPGISDPLTGLMKNANTTCLIGMPFRADLETALKIPVRMANDANCFALAEATLGACAGMVIMGTGVGGGLVVHGKILTGHHGIAGEWGHNFLDATGGPCYCGRTGCVETNISGKGLERYYEKATGRKLSLPHIVEAWHRSDPIASETMEQLFRLFGRAIASVINILDPDAIVLGGGVSNIPELYTHGVKAISEHLFNDRFETPVLPAKLGDSAGVFGAALLW